ncbi:uncharacterized protein LOC114528821 [Dendronephthya gigantea]|uniref:uncharacterized protein LOC114528821 n=1 Tax=Dendronephthya gigantea TaxID=151771 RepID=UPI001069302F|nr:uncharacterized protein LOC114528821 [Dendronephthya gigantea]
MALAFQRNQLGMKVTGTNVTVPNNPKAKLMYYLNCMATVLQLDELPREFTNYQNYYALDDTMVRHLVDLCKIVSPDALEGKCIFQVSDLQGSSNEFVELSSAKTTMVATSSVMMAGRNVQVAKIMLYKPVWRRTNYDQPMAELSRQISRPAITSSRSTRRRSSSCILL